jgi:hypothetical protein
VYAYRISITICASYITKSSQIYGVCYDEAVATGVGSRADDALEVGKATVERLTRPKKRHFSPIVVY